MKKTTGFKKKRIKAKIIFAVCLIVFAAALIGALILIDKANGDAPQVGGTGSGITSGITLPAIDVPIS